MNLTRTAIHVGPALILLALMGGCSSETYDTGTPVAVQTATPPPTPSPAPTATPKPAATPTPVLTGEEVYPGPVASVKVRLYAVMDPNGQFRPDPFYDSRSNTDVAFKDDVITLDVTPRNAKNQKCDGNNDPVWILENDRGVLRQRTTSNPYLYRADAVGKGLVNVRASVDGVLSNLIRVEIR
jgi:hypothetical protein